jgi:hypothetical protein
MTAAAERQLLLRPSSLPSSTLRYATSALLILSIIAMLVISSNVGIRSRPSILLDRAVTGFVASSPIHFVSSRGSLYQHDLSLLSKARPISAPVLGGKTILTKQAEPLLFPVVSRPVPYSAPYNVYMLWSRVMQDTAPGATGDIFRRALRLGHVEGGEYRDPKFLPELAGRQFDDIAATCCSVVAVPPLSGGFIVYGANGRRASMIRAFLANGNAMVISGGVVALEFINRMFYSQLEPVESNFDEGPFRKSSTAFGPWKNLPFDSLGQIGTDVYAVKPSSLPEGSDVLFTSPDGVGIFIMPFCQRLNPEYVFLSSRPFHTQHSCFGFVSCNALCRYGNPQPIIIPASRCASLKATGAGKCSCGTITYIGYDFHDNSMNSPMDHARCAVANVSVFPP